MKRVLAVLVLGCCGSTVAAQEDALLARAVQLATEGRGDSARAIVARRLAILTPADPGYAEALYAAGRVTDDVDRAMNYFRRVSIEYASSPWADRALLRLAQLSFGTGDVAAALRASEAIISDYPLSTELAEAQYWAGVSLLELGNPQDGCSRLGEAEVRADENIELANRARYQLGRCTALARGDAADSAPARPSGGAFSVQVAAVGTAAAADDVMRSLRQAGYESHVVRAPDGLFKVRVGRYPGRAQAQRIAAELKSRLGGSPFVVEEQ